MMIDLQFGSIKRARLPADWVAAPERNTAIMTVRTCHPSEHDDVEISFFGRRAAIAAETMKTFRSILGQSVHRIADDSEELISLAGIMGNAGNNQWTNKNRDSSGPSFRLASATTIQISRRNVLLVSGSFLDPSTRKTANEYRGIFIDAAKESARVEEVFLQVPASYGYYKFEIYAKIFNETISSFEWH